MAVEENQTDLPQREEVCFADLKLGWQIEWALKKMGYIKPTPIQAATISHAISGLDIVGQARTGTGKTAAFAIPILAGLESRQPRNPEALILAPTRELATQIRDEMRKIGEFKKARIVEVVGGKSIERQARMLRKGAHVVVGTPGRVLDLCDRRIT